MGNVFTPLDQGCYFDSARGRYIGEAVIEFAESIGFAYELEDNRETQIAEHEHYHEIWDEAETFLNNLAPEGYYFGSSEAGDWGLWKVVDDA